MRLVVGVECPDVAPVGLVAFGRARNLIGGEVVDLSIAATHETRNDIAAHIVARVFVGGIVSQGIDQRPVVKM